MKTKLIIAGTGVGVVALPVVAFAQETGTANAAVVSAMTTAASDMVATGNAIVPVALTVVTLMVAVTFGIKLFKRITGR